MSRRIDLLFANYCPVFITSLEDAAATSDLKVIVLSSKRGELQQTSVEYLVKVKHSDTIFRDEDGVASSRLK